MNILPGEILVELKFYPAFSGQEILFVSTVCLIIRDRTQKGALQKSECNLQEGGSPLREKVFSDIQHARSRKKKTTLTSKLRQHLSSSKVLGVGYGEIVPFSHEFHNPFPHNEVLILKISRPKIVSIVKSKKVGCDTTIVWSLVQCCHGGCIHNISKVGGI